MIRAVQHATPNYHTHSIPRDVKAAVLHVTEGTAESVDDWFARGSRAAGAPVSAHFLVTLDGALWQFVSIHDVAYHAGRVLRPTWSALPAGNPNDVTVGIEHEGTGLDPWPEAQLLTSTMLAAWLCHRFDWTPSARTFPMHREIFAEKSCPGPVFDRPAYVARVSAILAAFSAEIPTLVQGIR